MSKKKSPTPRLTPTEQTFLNALEAMLAVFGERRGVSMVCALLNQVLRRLLDRDALRAQGRAR